MKLKVISIATAILIATTININAQTLPLNEPPAYKPLKETKLFSGNVISWVSDENFYYSAFLLQTDNDRFLVKFSPRLGSRLTTTLQLGMKVSLNGIEVQGGNERNVVRLVTLNVGATSIYDNGPTGTVATVEEPIHGSGTIAHLQKNDLNQITGIVLYDKTILRVSLDAAEQLSSIAVVGTFVSYSGNQILRNGEFSPEFYTIVQCQAITIDERQYLIE